jgi:hypothetical protein
MNHRKMVLSLGLALAFLIMLPVSRASEVDQASRLTFNHSLHVPGRVLPAGTYWFVVPTPGIVQIFTSDRSVVLATLQAITAERPEPSGKTEITFANQGEMQQPASIVTWFYPGRTIGHEFIYSKQETAELARNRQQTVVSGN